MQLRRMPASARRPTTPPSRVFPSLQRARRRCTATRACRCLPDVCDGGHKASFHRSGVSRLHSADTHVRIDSERRVRDGLLGGGVGRPRQRVPGRIPDACAHRIGSAHPPGAGGLAGRAGGLDLEGSRCPCYAMLLCAMPCPPARTIRRSAPKLPVTANLQPSHSRPYALDPTTTTAAGRTLKIVLYVRMYALYVRGRRQSRWAAHNHGHSPPPPPRQSSRISFFRETSNIRYSCHHYRCCGCYCRIRGSRKVQDIHYLYSCFFFLSSDRWTVGGAGGRVGRSWSPSLHT